MKSKINIFSIATATILSFSFLSAQAATYIQNKTDSPLVVKYHFCSYIYNKPPCEALKQSPSIGAHTAYKIDSPTNFDSPIYLVVKEAQTDDGYVFETDQNQRCRNSIPPHGKGVGFVNFSKSYVEDPKLLECSVLAKVLR